MQASRQTLVHTFDAASNRIRLPVQASSLDREVELSFIITRRHLDRFAIFIFPDLNEGGSCGDCRANEQFSICTATLVDL